MKDQVRTNSELIEEISVLKLKIKELEQSESERKRVEKSLRDSEKRFRELAELLPETVYETDIHGFLTFVNRDAFDLFGYTPKDFTRGLNALDMIASEDHGRALENIQRVMNGENIGSIEYTVRRKDGSTFPAMIHSTVIMHDGKPAGLRGFIVDNTEQKRAGEELKKSEEKYRTIIENMEDGYHEVDLKGNFTLFNESVCKMVGYEREDLLGMNYRQYADEENICKIHQAYSQVYRTGEPVKNLEWQIIREDGDRRDIEVSISLIRNMEGHSTGFRSIVRDTTDRKRAEKALRESEARWKFALEGARDGVWDWDAVTNRVYFSDQWKAMLGYASHEVGDSLDEWDRRVHPADKTGAYSDLEHHFRRETETYQNEHRLLCKDGTYKWILDRGKVIEWTEDGKPRRVIGTHTDITERKFAEEALKSSLSLLGASLESTADGILIVDRNGKIARWNQKFTDMWKIPEEVLSSRDDEKTINYILTQLADPEKFVAKVRKLYEHPEESSFDQIEFADGRVFERYSQPQRIEDNIAGRVWSFRDISDRKRVEAEKLKLEEQYRQAQKMEAIGQLAGGIAHDFNNMLNIILGYSQMALMKIEPSNPLNANLKEIMNAAQRSADLVRQLLAFARKQTIAPKALDLNDTVSGMLNMLRKLIGEDIDLLWMPAANLWPVKMDPVQVDQLLANMAVNARDSISGVGKITIETGKAEFDEAYCAQHPGFVPGHYAMLVVSDDGCGMDKDTCKKIFEPFFTTKDVGKGTGMGLATVYGIVKQNNGFINVYSEPGKGTTFKIYLPWRKDERMTIDKPCAQAKPLNGTETVLIVEDEEELLKLGKAMLEELGYAVLTASTPGEAIRLAEERAGEIHLVLTDVVMPEMSGRDLQRRISALWPSLKFLFMSGYTANVIAHRGILDEGVNFLQKPFHMDVLAKKVREALNRP